MRGNETAVAYVLGMDSNGLGIVRSLGREGIPVVAVDFRPSAPGLKSRYCRPLLTPNPAAEPEGVLKVLTEQSKTHREKALLYPTSDAYVLVVSRFRHALSRNFLFAMPSESLLESIVNKCKLYELAEQIGIPYPTTRYPESIGDVERVKDEIEYPALIKPYYSHVWQETYRNKAFRVEKPAELVHRYKQVFDAKLQAMTQSLIPGPITNHIEVCAYLSEKHEPLAAFVKKKIRQYPTDFGVGVYMESIHDKTPLEIAVKFLREIRYRGAGEIEFKKDERDGEYKMIELNARYWLQNIQATCAGINFPLIQYLDLTGQQLNSPRDYTDGISWIDAVQDFGAFYELNRQGKLSITSWLKSISTADCHAFFERDDLVPFIQEYRNKLGRLPKSLLRLFE